MKPKQGTLALCSQGNLGLITSKSPVEVTYPDGSKGMAWTGIHLCADKFGEPWSSRNPAVLGFASQKLEQLFDTCRVIGMPHANSD